LKTIERRAVDAQSTSIERRSVEVPVPGGHLKAYSVRPSSGAVATVVFVHGRTFPSVPDFDLQVPGAGASFSFMEYLARSGIDCWCFDHRGFGASWKPPEGAPFTAHERAQDLLAVLPTVQRASTTPLTLAGLSLGCSAVAAAVKRRPDIAQRIVLLGPARWKNFGTLAWRWQWLRSVWKAGSARSRYITASFAELEKRLWVGEESRVNRAAFEAFVHGAIAADPQGSPDRVKALISDVIPFAGRPVFRTPVLAIRGSDDDIATEDDLEAVRRFVEPRLLSVRVFPRRKHDLHLYEPHDDVFACIADFVLSGRA
jgi:pimeloyl-ACP methyl ester carboxylesterase